MSAATVTADGGVTTVNNNKPFRVIIDNKSDANDMSDGVGSVGVIAPGDESQHSESISFRNLKEKNCESLSDNSSEGNRHDGIFKNGVPDLGECVQIWFELCQL